MDVYIGPRRYVTEYNLWQKKNNKHNANLNKKSN